MATPRRGAGASRRTAVAGIELRSQGVEAGRMPPGGRGLVNGFGRRGWNGPDPPPGDQPHRYVFHLYAPAHGYRWGMASSRPR